MPPAWDTFSGAGDEQRCSGKALVDATHTPGKEHFWRKRYVPSPSFLSLHLGVRAELIPAGTHCHHLLLEDWNRMEDEQGVIFVSMPSLLDPDLAPAGHHIVHTFTPSSMEAWQGMTPQPVPREKGGGCCTVDPAPGGDPAWPRRCHHPQGNRHAPQSPAFSGSLSGQLRPDSGDATAGTCCRCRSTGRDCKTSIAW